VGERIDDRRDCQRAHLEDWNTDVAVVRLSYRLHRRKDSYLLQTAMEGDVDLKKKSWVVRRGASDVPLTRASAVNTIITQALYGYLGQPVSTQPIHGSRPLYACDKTLLCIRQTQRQLTSPSLFWSSNTCWALLHRGGPPFLVKRGQSDQV
jgi:hypothetical protein